MRAPDAASRAAAAERLAGLATPAGALGRLGDLATWVSACQGAVPPRPLDDVRLVVFAGDHGVAAHGVSAYPPAITGAMVRTFVAGRAGVSALAAAHGVAVRVLDLGVDDDLDGLPADVSAHKVRRGSGAIHLEDALTAAEARRAIEVGRAVAAEEVAAGADLLLSGDMGIGNTTPASALVAAALGLPAEDVVGRGTGIDDAALRRKHDVVRQALARAGLRTDDPVETLAALGSADLAATVGYLVAAAEAGVPVLLDGLMSVACALTAERLAPGTAAWCAAGHRSTEPAQSLALEKLGLEPLLDLGLRLGEGSGAVAAVPVLRSAVALLRDTALLADLL
ncbi:nicotinate-nucleotide--dimethylbenzimidazole phosphoribosyltransferase [Nocardioides litoris]|uniref:nicotinate-nucleotide--dimethylbenzimidazole phosphoribosyltransferase n=1 Tax=Nocardioides litoris TaxID=1926648 RepID=UPI0011249264|nr:nicotinate-nucleotide--dimethylbenzimidazole phosphoribosyltransferase [Nocardioides litoris]